MTEAEADACEIHKENNEETEKTSLGKRKRQADATIMLPSNKCEKLEDRLSGLLNDLIISVLSRLTLKEAARTSVLSQRWKNMWTWTTGTLYFDYLDEASRFYSPRLCIHYRQASDNFLRGNEFARPWRPFPLFEKASVVEKSSFVTCVNHVLSLHQGQTVDKFEMCCTILGRLDREIINKWVEIALRKNVRILRLDFRSPYISLRGNYSIKKSFLSTCCSLDSFLRVLDLKNVDVTGHCVSYILVKCPFLEELCVEKSSKLIELRVRGPLPQLKCLKIKYCLLLSCIEIRALSLNSFTYHGGDIPVTFERPPRLIHASYGLCYASVVTANMRQQFSSCATCLESLVLNIQGHPAYPTTNDDGLPDFPVLENLRRLELGVHFTPADRVINFVASLLKKCPILDTLSLSTRALDLNRSIERPRSLLEGKGSICMHDSITVLEFVDNGRWYGMEHVPSFQDYGMGMEIEIAYFMLSTLPSLQQVIVSIPEVFPTGDFLFGGPTELAKIRALEFVDLLSNFLRGRGEGKFPHVSCAF